MPLFSKAANTPAQPSISPWRPFQPLPDLAHAREAVRSCGTAAAWMVGWSIVFTYAAPGTLIVTGSQELARSLYEAPSAGLASHAAIAALTLAAAGLAIVIRRRQPLWAVVLLAVWSTAEILLTAWLTLQVPNPAARASKLFGYAIFAAMLATLLVIAIRGALAMRRMQRAGG